ncbi:chlorophyll a-b binding protein, chloroplastic [Haematococcus lacustris]|uniref:Chlorophyll a-b binding protein, chloroplastic n=1 Tax=Haematococcus lacustris TaxID=44745 RepID=A0A699ZP43_HAELA|nr:chlorophyll a-b binding protein, chloroplastic [Haematococcus lacustris]
MGREARQQLQDLQWMQDMALAADVYPEAAAAQAVARKLATLSPGAYESVTATANEKDDEGRMSGVMSAGSAMDAVEVSVEAAAQQRELLLEELQVIQRLHGAQRQALQLLDSLGELSTDLASGKIAKGRKVPTCALPTDLAVSEVATGKSVEVDRQTYVFDPAGLSNTASIQDIRRWRESEITHGRVAMLAAVGFIVGEQLEDSALFYNFDGQITGPAINHFQQVKQGFWEPLLVAIGLCESYRVSLGWSTPTGNKFNTLKDDYVMG